MVKTPTGVDRGRRKFESSSNQVMFGGPTTAFNLYSGVEHVSAGYGKFSDGREARVAYNEGTSCHTLF